MRVALGGGDLHAGLEYWYRSTLALRSGLDAMSISEQMRGIRCPSPSWEKGGRIFSCSDAIARVLERRLHEAAKTRGQVSVLEKEIAYKPNNNKRGDIVGVCPDCGSALWHIEGCMVCNSCGYSKCG